MSRHSYFMPIRIKTFRPQPVANTFDPRHDDHKVYDQRRWRRLSKIVLREEPIYRIWGTVASTQVDHIVPCRQDRLSKQCFPWPCTPHL